MSIMRTAWVRDTEFRGDARGQLGHLSALVNPLKKRKPKLRVRLLPNESRIFGRHSYVRVRPLRGRPVPVSGPCVRGGLYD